MTYKFSKSFFKPLTILPALIMICLIFGFSNQDGNTSGGLSQKVSEQIISVYDSVFQKKLNQTKIHEYANRIEYGVRKAAHVSEYLVLALLVSLPLYTYGLKGKQLFFTSLFLCILCAAGDEFHQSFIPGRTPAFKDVLIDSIGIAGGSGIFLFFSTLLQKSK